jgi:hypothetical protein
MAQTPEQQRAAFDAAIRNAPARQVNVGASSPLDRVQREAASIGVNVQTVSEQARAQTVTANPGATAPTFDRVPTRTPFDPRQIVPMPAPRRAGGSKS